jgi:hypothetical protein
MSTVYVVSRFLPNCDGEHNWFISNAWSTLALAETELAANGQSVCIEFEVHVTKLKITA